MAKILIKNGRIWDGEKFFYADILTEDDKISKIEGEISDTADFVFDATGKIVSAGLVDCHVHFKGISSDSFGIDSAMSCIPFGVTSAIDASGVNGDKSLLDSFLVKNRTFVCPEIRDNHAYFENTDIMLKKYGDKAIGIKVYFDIYVSEVADITPLKEILEYAEKNSLIIMVHSSNPPVAMSELLSVLRKGDILTHAYHGGINNVSDDNYECIKNARKRGVIIDAGFAGHIHTDFKVLKDAIKCGEIPDIISTDITKTSAYKRGGRYGLTMCMSIAKHLGMREEDIFKAVTITPANATGMDGGTLSVGKTADIAVLEYADEGFDLTDKAGNHIYSKTGYRNILTVANGEIEYRR